MATARALPSSSPSSLHPFSPFLPLPPLSFLSLANITHASIIVVNGRILRIPELSWILAEKKETQREGSYRCADMALVVSAHCHSGCDYLFPLYLYDGQSVVKRTLRNTDKKLKHLRPNLYSSVLFSFSYRVRAIVLAVGFRDSSSSAVRYVSSIIVVEAPATLFNGITRAHRRVRVFGRPVRPSRGEIYARVL